MFALGPVGNQSKHQIEQNQVLFIMPIEELFLKPFLSGKTFFFFFKYWCRDGSRAKSQHRDNPAKRSYKIQLKNQSRAITELWGRFTSAWLM